MKRVLASLAAATIALSSLAFGRASAAPVGDAPRYVHLCPPPAIAGRARCFAIFRLGGQPADPSSPAYPSGYHPSDLQAAYDLQAAAQSGGHGQTLADVIWFDDPNAESDLAVYRRQFGLPPCTTANGCFKKVDQNGGTTYPPPYGPNAGEISLDIDMYSAICPNCHIVLVEANNSAYANLGQAENEAVKLGATAISNSWGFNEAPYDLQLDSRYFNHPGVMITAASGDSGYGTFYPATSQYVTAAGGTTLFKVNGVWHENAWSGGGSGCSQYDPKPSWQHDPLCPRRTVADVAAEADPNTGVAVYDTYQSSGWGVAGGTSVAAPIIAGVYALAGNGASLTYGSYGYSHTSSLYDITRGSNGSCGTYLCNAVRGYDGPTGNGTPNGIGAF